MFIEYYISAHCLTVELYNPVPISRMHKSKKCPTSQLVYVSIHMWAYKDAQRLARSIWEIGGSGVDISQVQTASIKRLV